MLPKTAVVKEFVDQMELVTVILLFTEIIAQVNLEISVMNIQFILKLTFSFQFFYVAACHYLFTCSGHGLCSDVGTCQCDEGFFGDSCSSKHDNSLLVFCKVLYICVGFWLLAHLTLDLFQVEKKKMLLLAEQMPQMTTISLKIVEVVILSENQVLNGPIAKNQCIYTIQRSQRMFELHKIEKKKSTNIAIYMVGIQTANNICIPFYVP